MVDAEHTNGPGFLATYKGQRHHLIDFRDDPQPSNLRGYFNMKHYVVRNCIEWCFGMLKKRWATLRERSFYQVKTQNMIILVYCKLHNYIRSELKVDPIEQQLKEEASSTQPSDVDDEEVIHTCETCPPWTAFKDNLVEEMYNPWRAIT